MKLLAVDDNPQILEVLPAIFRQAGLPKINLASSAAAALALLEDPDHHFDVLLLDIEMPQMDGFELCKRIRKMARYRTTPIIMLTAASESGRIERAFAAGADDYITKPFEVKDIVTRVRVAERMASKGAKTVTLDYPLGHHKELEGDHPMRQTDPLRVAGAAQLILPFSLGNYLSQLSRQGLQGCNIFALRLLDVGMLFASSKTHEFAFAITQIVDAVAEVVDCPRLLMAYQGNGTFLCITQSAKPPAWPEIEEQVQDRLNADARVLESGWPMGLNVAIGNPITPNASSNQRVKKTFERVVERAMHRERTKGRQALQLRQMAQATQELMVN